MDENLCIFDIDTKQSNVNITESYEKGNDFSQIIPIETKNDEPFVNARRIHESLQSKQNFRDWIKSRITKTMAIPIHDFIVEEYDWMGNILNSDGAHKFMRSDNKSVSKREYWVTTEIAKQFCMLEGNAIGMMIRRYFIECESKFKEMMKNRLRLPATYQEALRALADEVDRRENAERLALESEKIARQEKAEKEMAIKTLEEKQPDIDFANSFELPNEDDMLVRDVAKKLEQNGIIIGERNLRLLLQKWNFFTKSGDGYELTRNVINKKYAKYREVTKTINGYSINRNTVYVTQKGYKKIINVIMDSKTMKDFLEFGTFSSEMKLRLKVFT